MVEVQSDYEIEEQDQPLETDDPARSAALRQQKIQARRERRAEVVKNTGRTMEATGAATQAGGKTLKTTGKVVGATGRGMERGGGKMAQAGAEMSATGVGAIVGVPLAVLGGATAAVGAGAQAAGKGMEVSGQAMDQAGREIRAEGKTIERTGKRMEGLVKGKADKDDDSKDKKSPSSLLRSLKKDALDGKMDDRLKQMMGGANADDGDGGFVSNALSQMTDWLLRQAWLNLITSWGFTLIWINCHVFMTLVVGEKYFKKLGHEWASMAAVKVETAFAGPLGKKLARLASDKIGFLEFMLLLFLDFLFLLIVFFIVFLIVMMVLAVQQVSDGVSYLKFLFPALYMIDWFAKLF